MPSLHEIEEENKQFAKQWRTQMARTFIALFISVILLLGFSPDNALEYTVSLIFVAPLFLWANKSPKNEKKRNIVSLSCYILSATIYFGAIQNS